MSGSGTKRSKPKQSNRKKKKKDPNAPKKPRSAYILFCTDVREEVKSENKEAKPAQLMQLMGSRWNNLDAVRKEEYNNKAKIDKQRYSEEMKGYQAPEEESDDEDEAPTKRRKGKGKGGKKKKDANEPKRSPSAYLIYSQRVRPQVKAENPEAKSSEIMKKTGAMWQSLSEDEKKPFVIEAQQQKEKYEIAKSEYKKHKAQEEDDEDQGGDNDEDDDNDGGGGHDDDDDDEDEDDEDDD